MIETYFYCIFLNSVRSHEINKCSMSMTECIKPYLYRRRRKAFIRPLNLADNSPPRDFLYLLHLAPAVADQRKRRRKNVNISAYVAKYKET